MLSRGDELMTGGCDLESGGSGGGGSDDIELVSELPNLEVRTAEAGTIGCEKGLPGPRGASAIVWTAAEPGVDVGL